MKICWVCHNGLNWVCHGVYWLCREGFVGFVMRA